LDIDIGCWFFFQYRTLKTSQQFLSTISSIKSSSQSFGRSQLLTSNYHLLLF
jgi:hypothetical protein